MIIGNSMNLSIVDRVRYGIGLAIVLMLAVPFFALSIYFLIHPSELFNMGGISPLVLMIVWMIGGSLVSSWTLAYFYTYAIPTRIGVSVDNRTLSFSKMGLKTTKSFNDFSTIFTHIRERNSARGPSGFIGLVGLIENEGEKVRLLYWTALTGKSDANAETDQVLREYNQILHLPHKQISRKQLTLKYGILPSIK